TNRPRRLARGDGFAGPDAILRAACLSGFAPDFDPVLCWALGTRGSPAVSGSVMTAAYDPFCRTSPAVDRSSRREDAFTPGNTVSCGEPRVDRPFHRRRDQPAVFGLS